MDITFPEAATWTIRGIGTVAIAAEAAGALLIAGASGVALAHPVPVSREFAEQIGAAERAEHAKLIADAHGGPVALPTPSPFMNESYVRSLPTQSQIDRQPAPSAQPGVAPYLPPSSVSSPLETRYGYNDARAITGEHAGALIATQRCFPESGQGFRSYEGPQGLRAAMKTPAGWDCHHLVEQSRTAQFGTEAIQNTANAINLPESLHKAVSKVYTGLPREGSPAADMGLSHVRDYVKTLSFAEQRQFSINAIKAALESPDVHISAEDRATVEKELQGLENRDLKSRLDSNFCTPGNFGRPTPQIPDILNAVQQLQDQHGISLPRPQSIEPWNGKDRVGSFVDLGDGLVAQHLGKGAYQYMNVQQNLGGVQPPIGQQVALSQSGQVEPLQQMQPRQGLG